jgi:hypothetical protein
LLLRAGRLPPLPGQRRWAAGLVGAWLARRLGNQRAQHIQQQLDHGGLLLWVRTWDTAQENLAVEILKRQSARDVHVH